MWRASPYIEGQAREGCSGPGWGWVRCDGVEGHTEALGPDGTEAQGAGRRYDYPVSTIPAAGSASLPMS
ncbi:hypothetical protein WJX84_007007 [Apatococcus fuscideae]|uniref:Uncharacterized protein n=1 Tax=Apatococcus fuscideae TaxID=2026836 RepID=A0AAW1SPN9_9CHLO